MLSSMGRAGRMQAGRQTSSLRQEQGQAGTWSSSQCSLGLAGSGCSLGCHVLPGHEAAEEAGTSKGQPKPSQVRAEMTCRKSGGLAPRTMPREPRPGQGCTAGFKMSVLLFPSFYYSFFISSGIKSLRSFPQIPSEDGARQVSCFRAAPVFAQS